MIYQLYIRIGKTAPDAAMIIDLVPAISFLFDPANTDYQQFKQAINDDTAQLEDADGNLMSAADAKAFVKELP